MALLINDVSARVAYTATGGQTEFTVTFEFFANSDLVVYKNDVLMTYDAAPADETEYSVTGAGSNGTKKITFGAGLTVGDVVVIYREVPIERISDFPTSGPFDIETLNTELDKLVALIQQRRDVQDRALRLSQQDSASGLNAMPDKVDLANKVLAFDSNGDPVASNEDLADLEGSAAAAAISAAAAAASEAAAAASETAAAASEAAAGDIPLQFQFASSTTMADPGAGKLRLNNAAFASVTAIAISDNAANTGNPDVSALLNQIDGSSSTIRGYLKLVKVTAPENFAIFTFTGITDNAGWVEAAVAHVSSNGSFSVDDALAFGWVRTGDAGDGDMTSAVYDPQTIQGDAFDLSTHTGDSDDITEGAVNLLMTVSERSKLSGIEIGATADQSNAEIETAYNAQVAEVSQAEAEAGTGTSVRRWTPQRVSQAIAALASGASLIAIQVFTASGTFTPTSGASNWLVFATGGGGGGGSSGISGDNTAGAGGEGGGTAIKFYNSTEMGASAAVTIGAAGSGGSSSAGGDGGDTSFNPVGTGVTITGGGGDGGNQGNGTSTQPALGGHGEGVASNGDLNLGGGAGGMGSNVTDVGGGTGGASFWGGGGRGGSDDGTNMAGQAGVAYGSGGGGGDDGSAGGPEAGGAGAAGVVLVLEFA